MRVIAGEHKGRPLRAPKGDATRPTTDRVRESLFSALASARGGLEGAVVLDAFAGSGALGIEAASRGAAHVTFCERGREALATLRANASMLDAQAFRIVAGDVLAHLPAPPAGRTFDLVLLDPPYALEPARVRAMLEQLDAAGSLADDVLISYEHARDADLTAFEDPSSVQCGCGFSQLSTRAHASSAITFFTKGGPMNTSAGEAAPKAQASRGIVPGTFDPITEGHIDIIRRAAQLFDEVVVAVAASPGKGPSGPLFSLDERVALVRESCASLGNVVARPFEGLLVEFAREVGATAAVKGLRAITDFEYEFQMAAVNFELAPEFETVFIMAPPQYMYLSSSIVRELASLGGDFQRFVPPCVYEALRAKYAE